MRCCLLFLFFFAAAPEVSAQARVGTPLMEQVPQDTSYSIVKGKKIILSCDCEYALYDAFGNIVRQGESSEIDIRKLERGGYYLLINGKSYGMIAR